MKSNNGHTNGHVCLVEIGIWSWK